MGTVTKLRDGCYLAENAVTAAEGRRIRRNPVMFFEADGPEQVGRMLFPLIMVVSGEIVVATDTDGELWSAA